VATFTFTTELLSLNKSSREGSANRKFVKNIKINNEDWRIKINKSGLTKSYRAKFITKVHFILTTFTFTAVKASKATIHHNCRFGITFIT
jgi:hypothetical protein